MLKKLDPIIESKNEEFRSEVDQLKDEKHKLREKFRADQDAYYKQQQLLQDIEFKTKIKNRLIREEQRKKREEEEKALEEEEKKQVEKVNPHQDDISTASLCFLSNFSPRPLRASHQLRPEPDPQERGLRAGRGEEGAQPAGPG